MAAQNPSKIPQDHFAAVAGAQLGQHVIHGIGDQAGGAVAKEPVGAGGMPAPEMDLVARVINGAGLPTFAAGQDVDPSDPDKIGKLLVVGQAPG
jgi:hypothetical protein